MLLYAVKPVRFATYNLRMLCLDGAMRDRRLRKSPASWLAVAQVIDSLDADVLVVQEVGSQEALDKLQTLLPRPYPHATFCPSNSSLGIHLAVLSRHTFAVTSHREVVLWDEHGSVLEDYPNREASRDGRLDALRFQRDFPRISVDFADGAVELFAAHLKSLRSYAWMRHTASVVRAAEARAAARLLKRHLGKRCLVMGDFNAPPRDASLAPLLEASGLWDPVAAELERPGHLEATYRCGAHKNRIDFALLTPGARALYVENSVRIHRPAQAAVASDHFPLSVDLRLPA